MASQRTEIAAASSLMPPPNFPSSVQSFGSRMSRTSRMSKYGVNFEPPKDDAVHYYADTKSHSFFEKGRDFESTYTNHKYTEEEKQTLSMYESQDYLPSHSEVYKNWIKRQPQRNDWDQWLMMGMIGFSVGLIGFLLHQIIEFLTDIRIEWARERLAEGHTALAWVWCFGFSLLFLIVGSALVVFIRPSASGSGIPELIGFLNGTAVRHIFNVKTLVIKFLSCCLSVGSGLPVGPEGPMIHLGSLVGAGVSQFKSDTLMFKLPFFERFRNSEDRRNFVSAGAAAGVSAAFGAPVGGLLFSMEEVSSFWNERLSWQIFFCCMVSVFTSALFNSAFKGFDFTGGFGLFKSTQYILFKVYHGFDFHVAVFVPTMIIGVLGGVLGAVFTFINLKIARARKMLLANVKSKWLQKFIRLIEPIIIAIIYITTSVYLPAAFPCTPFKCAVNSTNINGTEWCVKNVNETRLSWLADPWGVENYTCPEGVFSETDEYVNTTQTYNEVATLLMTNGERAIRHLFSRETHFEFSAGPLCTVLVIYFLCACWSAGTAISSGLVVPMLLIGALYGRMIGLAMVHIFGVFQKDSMWAWIDPGAMALIGAASFFGGVSRLTMSLTVIMMELTNDIQFLLPIMVAIMVSKWVGDFVTHPLYHALLELKCIPFLASEPTVFNKEKKRMNLELYTAGNVMSSPPICLNIVDNVARVSDLLLNTTHSGFPVLHRGTTTPGGRAIFAGTITRLELTVLLMNKASFGTAAQLVSSDVTAVEYEQLTLDKLTDPKAAEDILYDYAYNPKWNNTKIYLKAYINQSAMTIRSMFSLHRTYIIFRSLGLRHLTVTNTEGVVTGIITRRDLMGFNLEEKLDKAKQNLNTFKNIGRTLIQQRRPPQRSTVRAPVNEPISVNVIEGTESSTIEGVGSSPFGGISLNIMSPSETTVQNRVEQTDDIGDMTNNASIEQEVKEDNSENFQPLDDDDVALQFEGQIRFSGAPE